MADLIEDARYALRTLTKNPGFAASALLTIALAIGALTAIFAIANAVLFRALPYPDSERLVRLHSVDPREPLDRGTVSLPDLDDWQTRTGAFSSTAGYVVLPQVLLGRGDPQELSTAYVTGSFFEVLGTPMSLGRALDESDALNASRNVVISTGLWRSVFGGDANVLGTAVSLQGEPYTIVGVANPDLRFPAPSVALWTPQAVLSDRAIGQRTRDNRDFSAVARLAAGVSVESALARVRAVAAQLAAEYPATNERQSGADVLPLLATMVAQVERALLLVLGVVGFIALIACANVANLLLARGTARSHEIATRISLGASRPRVARQLMTESCVLSLLGGALGVAFAFAAVRVVLALYGSFLPRLEDVRIDATTLAFAFAASMAAGAFFGCLPAWRIARTDLRRHLAMSRGIVGSASRLRGALVAGEVALAVVLVVGALLMSRSFLTLRAVDSGFDPDRVLAVSLQVNVSSMPAGTTVSAYLVERRREIRERLAALPGVEYAATTSRLPLRDGASRFTFRVMGDRDPNGRSETADARNVSADYFQALGIPVLRGATPLTDPPITFGAQADRFEGQRPIAVSASAAERFWPGEDAIGKVIDGGWFEAVVVGVVGDVRHVGLAESPGPTLYFADGPQINATAIIRSEGDPALLTGPVRAAIRELDPNQSIRSMVTFRDLMADSIASDRFFTLLYVAFGALALTLAAVGVYGVVHYTVGQRTREIGLRIAIGASPGAVLKTVFARAMRPVVAGVVLGSLSAAMLARGIQQQLYGVDAYDPWSFLVAPIVLFAAAMLACYAPARTAARVNPVVALRSE